MSGSKRWWMWRVAAALGVAAVLHLTLMSADRRLTPTSAEPAPTSRPPAQEPKPETKPAPKPEPTPLDQAGLTRIDATRRDAAPTGRDVIVAHVEGGAGDYSPNINADGFKGIRFNRRSGESRVNGHADHVGALFYGRQIGAAPGIPDVLSYTANDWLADKCLNTGDFNPPRFDGAMVVNHSWISENSPLAVQVLRRVDYLADRYDVVVCAGVNNGVDKAVPALMGSAYNVIAVGGWGGNNSGGYTRIETEGRCKPDLVGPGSLTSFSTPIVAGVAARLIEAGRGLPAASGATRLEVVKAVMMAGADKPGNWKREPGRPLDDHFGAGRVRADVSLAILEAGAQKPGRVRSGYGWDFSTMERRGGAVYRFESPRPAGEVSIMLVWNRRIDGRIYSDLRTLVTRWVDHPRLADFDLKLIATDDAGNESELAASNSEIDNVEHIHLKALPAGRYRVEVRRNDALPEDWDYALAWRFEPAPPPEAAPEAARDAASDSAGPGNQPAAAP